MQSFTFHTPTEIIFGKESELQTADMVKKHGGSKVILVYGQNSVEKSGLLGKIEDSLTSAGLEVIKHGGATPNPHLSFAKEGIKKALDFGVDFVLAIGGGSAIDAAKAIAHGTKNPETDIWKFWLREEIVTKSLPIGVVLTISAAGSETSTSAVITNTETGKKRGLNTDFNRPRFAIMNPELTYSLPKYQIACGIADILMHSLDRYFSPEVNENKHNEMTDEIAESVMRVVVNNALKVLNDPTNYDAQSEIMWAGSISHNGITGLGRTMDFTVHQLAHELGGKFDVAHGAALTTMWGSWARYNLHINSERFRRLGKKVLGVGSSRLAVAEMEKFFKLIGMPTNFTELKIGVQPKEVIDELADSCVFYGKRLVGTFNPLDRQAVWDIFEGANV